MANCDFWIEFGYSPQQVQFGLKFLNLALRSAQ